MTILNPERQIKINHNGNEIDGILIKDENDIVIKFVSIEPPNRIKKNTIIISRSDI